MKIFIAAHSHIDAAWLWTLNETIDVCAKSFDKVLRLLDRHPGVVYVQSSALYYKWMEERHPEIFSRILKAVKEGRWKVVLPYVESDAYMPSGETLIRGIVYAQRYFAEKFGVEPKTLWLPDSFGFSSTLPSLAAGCGVRYFYTQKLNWNDTILFPHRVFEWRGPDGRSLLAYISPGGYSGPLSKERVEKEAEEMKRQGVDAVLTLYGYGDHGGGIDEEMASAADKLVEEGFVEPGGPDEFLRFIEEAGYRLPVWEGELYLQYHRGVWTTQAEFKRRFRQAETLLIEAETLYSIASMTGIAGERGARLLGEAWERLLTLSFHDIISGSSIREVYEEGEKILAEVRDRALGVAAAAMDGLIGLGDTKPGRLYVFNTLPWRRESVIVLEEGVVHAGEMPPLGYTPAALEEGYRVDVEENGSALTVSSKRLTASFDRRSGALVSLKARGKEFLSAPVLLRVYVDEPSPGRRTIIGDIDAVVFDAWELYHLHGAGGTSFTVLKTPEEVRVRRLGSQVVEVEAKYRYTQEGRPDSVFTLTWRVDGASPWVELRIRADWHAAHRLVKLVVPLPLRRGEAYFGQPYGWVRRRAPCSPDASLYDYAMWEVPANKWVYVPYTSGEGLLTVSDSIYGYSFNCTELGASVIRAPHYPRPLAGGDEGYTDQGVHEARIALAPMYSVGGMDVIEKTALEFLRPPMLWRAEREGSGLYSESYSAAEARGAILTAIEPLSGGEYLLRLYNPEPVGVEAEVRLPARLIGAWEALHGGRPLGEAVYEENRVKVKMRARSVATVRVRIEKTLS